jgi:hypothetical protein
VIEKETLLPQVAEMDGCEVTHWFSNLEDLQIAQRKLIDASALVCVSPLRHERCDDRATRIFWQDDCEWYPCCSRHFPGGEQWTGHTRFRGGDVSFQCFAKIIKWLLEDGFQSRDPFHPFRAFLVASRLKPYDRARAS